MAFYIRWSSRKCCEKDEIQTAALAGDLKKGILLEKYSSIVVAKRCILERVVNRLLRCEICDWGLSSQLEISSYEWPLQIAWIRPMDFFPANGMPMWQWREGGPNGS